MSANVSNLAENSDRRQLADPFMQENAMDHRLRRFVREILAQKRQEQKESEYDLPGLDRVLNSKRSLFYRFLWLLIICCFIVAFMLQIGLRLQYYLSYPLAVDALFNSTDAIEFPKLLLCSFDPIKLIPYKKVYEIREGAQTRCLVQSAHVVGPKYNLTYAQYNELDDIRDEMLSAILVEKVGLELVEHSMNQDVMQLLGKCLQIWSDKRIPFRTENYMKISLAYKGEGTCNFLGYAYAFMDLDSMINIQALTFGNSYVNMHLTGSVRKYQSVNSPTKPCLNAKEHFHCFWTCASEIILLDKRITCWMDMHYLEKTNVMKALPYCGDTNITGSELWETWLRMNEAFTIASKDTLCSCPRRCSQVFYGLHMNLVQPNIKGTIYSFSYRDPVVTVISERFAYDIIAFICDVGGNLGLYLGLSILSLVNLGFLLLKGLSKKFSS